MNSSLKIEIDSKSKKYFFKEVIYKQKNILKIKYFHIYQNIVDFIFLVINIQKKIFFYIFLF